MTWARTAQSPCASSGWTAQDVNVGISGGIRGILNFTAYGAASRSGLHRSGGNMLRLIALLVLLPVGALASDLVEPTANADGSPLDDLDSCTVVVTETLSGTTGSQVFQATSPAGGGTHTFDTGSILPTGVRELTATAICRDTGGNDSAQSNSISTFRPDNMAPAAPTLVE